MPSKTRDVDQLERELAECHATIRNLRAEVERLRGEVSEQIRIQEARERELEAERIRAEDELTQHCERIGKLERKVARLLEAGRKLLPFLPDMPQMRGKAAAVTVTEEFKDALTGEAKP